MLELQSLGDEEHDSIGFGNLPLFAQYHQGFLFLSAPQYSLCRGLGLGEQAVIVCDTFSPTALGHTEYKLP